MGAMKVMKKRQTGAKMSKSGIAESLCSSSDLKKSQCMKILDHLAEIGTKEVKQNGKFVLPGLVMIKTRVKPATQAGHGDVWQGCQGEGHEGQNSREGIRYVSPEKELLKCCSRERQLQVWGILHLLSAWRASISCQY